MANATEPITLPISGMTCGHCVMTVRKALEGVPGVQGAVVDLQANRAEVTLADSTVDSSASRDRLKAAVEAAGYSVPEEPSDDHSHHQLSPPTRLVSIDPMPKPESKPETKHKPDGDALQDQAIDRSKDAHVQEPWDLTIGGMHCASCVTRVEKALEKVPGVREARVNMATESARVILEHGHVNEQELERAVAAAGYSAKRSVADSAAAADEMRAHRESEVAFWRQRLIVGVGLTLPLVLLAYAPMAAPAVFGHASWIGWAMMPLATALQAYLGGPYALSAWKLLLKRSSNMDTLIALGTTTAYGYSLANLLMETIPAPVAVGIALVVVALVDAAGAFLFGQASQSGMPAHQH